MQTATIETDFGNMTLRFFPDIAPQHVENFVSLAKEGFYDNKTFHRIIDGFMIQGGCPRGDGTGSGPRRLPAEFSKRPHEVGTLSMARSNDPNSASCQFFICLDRCDFLDGKYTVFGELADEPSRQTLKKIGQVEVRDGGSGEKSKPVKPVTIRKVTVQDLQLRDGTGELHTDWSDLDSTLLRIIRERLGCEFSTFAQLCESIGLLQSNLLQISKSMYSAPVNNDAHFACSLCASSVASAANHFGGQGDLDLAEKLAGWALRLEPSHAPALMCLATVSDVRGDAAQAARHRAEIDHILERIRRAPKGTLSAFEQGLLETFGG